MPNNDVPYVEPRRNFYARQSPRRAEWVLCPHCQFESVLQQVNEPACCLSCRLSIKAGIPTKREKREAKARAK